ncbi:2-dehydropantoate 2-reductase [Vibrio ponticus]|uniref:2-dehydropantoate 2-reductase n=1 Tax=Vibrio ponticus TaxID=265668 RepID=A0A3N3E6V2_9VIBR|nr:2-dehydropantoate 2-reductase [Vibrio ponticus]ROV62278.1 2-dehydropantoate 2-reductase [Vibrio ponticus]
MNITVVGPGAIGSLWASYLHDAGHHVCLWSRQNAAELMVQRDDHPAQRFTNNDPQSLLQADILLVTLKAPLVEQVLSSIRQHIAPEAIVMLMHNGMGTADSVKALMPDNPLVLATTTHGAYRKSANHVMHTGQGKTLLGAANHKGKQCGFLVDVFNHALTEVAWHDEIDHALWNKLAINCAINPLTAIHQIRNGELAQTEFRDQLQSIINEVCCVMQAEGIDAAEANLTAMVDQVIHATSNNFSSMEQDIAHQRTSEIDFITGYLIKCANKHNISVPTNHALYKAIKQIEQSW